MSESKYDPSEITDPEMRKFVEKSRAHAEALGIPREEPESEPETLEDTGSIAEKMQRVRLGLVQSGLIDRDEAIKAEQEKERRDKEFRDRLEKI